MFILFHSFIKTVPFGDLILEFAQVIPINRSKVISDVEKKFIIKQDNCNLFIKTSYKYLQIFKTTTFTYMYK